MDLLKRIFKIIGEAFELLFSTNNALQKFDATLKTTTDVICMDKVLIKYTNIKESIRQAEGVMYFRGHCVKILSGGYGRGHAPKGKYKAYKLLTEERAPFTMFGVGWQVPMELIELSKDNLPADIKRATNMTGIAIHPDGNVPGSLGCIVEQFDNKDQNNQWKYFFIHYFTMHNSLEVEIV